MSKKKKDQKKSLSVNDIPVEKHPQQLLNSLDNASYIDLLNRFSTPSYNRNRKSEGCLNEIIEEEKKSKISILEKTLQDEDAEKERQKRENRKKTFGEIDLRRPPSVSPTFMPPTRKPYGADCFSTAADILDFPYMDSENQGNMDMEMMDLGGQKQKSEAVFLRGNEEKICNEYSDSDMVKEPNGESVITNSNPAYKDRVNFFSRPETEMPLRKSMKSATGVMSVTSECLTDDSGSTGGETGTNVNSFDYGCLPRFPVFPPVDARYANEGHQLTNERTDLTNSKVEEKKRRIQQRKAKEEKNSYVVSKPLIGDCMGELSITEVVNYIGELPKQKKSEESRQDRSRKKTTAQKDTHCATTIGNHQGKAPATAPINKSQNSTANASAVTKENKKSPNKKNRKGGSTAGAESNPASRLAGRISTEDGEEEFLSADEGVISSNSDDPNAPVLSASEVMMDGANYRADSDDLSCIENQVAEEQEFITVESRDKKKKSVAPPHAQRTGSTGKVERRNQRAEQQPRRNSMEDRIKPRPRPQTAASLADYLDDKKSESHAKAKVVPFKEPKKKQDRLESTADSEYMDAQDEMALPTPTHDGTNTPEKGFSYADAAKKSAEPSRENSPACLNNKSNDSSVTPGGTPSPQVSVDDASVAHITINSKTVENDATAPVRLRNNDLNEDKDTGLSFFYEENTFSNNDDAPSVSEDGAFVLNLGGKKVKFAMGMAAPISLQPVDDKHRAMVDLMMNRWKLFMTQGPDPTYYAPNVQV